MKKNIAQLKAAVESYAELKKLYLSKYALLSDIRDSAKSNAYSLEDLVNIIYIFREISRIADDMRKECDGLGHLLENLCCATYVLKNENSPESSEPIRASLATGTPKLTLGVKLPRPNSDPENFKKLIDYLDINYKAIETKAVKLYWPGLCKLASELAEQGKPLPPGINPDDTYPTYGVNIMSRQDLDELARELKERSAEECDKLLTERPKTR